MELNKMPTLEEQEQMREFRRNEVGSESPCPFCKRPRVMRSDYVRCNPCGVNWLMEEMHLRNYLDRDPRVARAEAVRMGNIARPTAERSAADAE